MIRSGAAQECPEIGGDWVSITAPARFRWLATHEPETFSAIAHVGMLGSWILTRLCGDRTTDPSLGSSSGMFDLATRTWSERLIEVVGLEPSMFPAVREPGEVVGAVTPEAASDTGLRQGTPCVVGGADTQLGLVGIGVARPRGDSPSSAARSGSRLSSSTSRRSTRTDVSGHSATQRLTGG